MPSPAFHNHTCDSSAETTISHQLPGACHHAIPFYQGCILGHCGAKKGGGAISCPQGKSSKSHLALSTDTPRCGCVGAGVSTLRESDPGKPGWGDCGFGAGFRKLTAKTGDGKHTGRQNIPNFRAHSGDPAAGRTQQSREHGSAHTA